MNKRTFVFNLVFLICLSVMIILWARFFVVKVTRTEMINSPETDAGRIAFLTGYGWQTENTPVLVEKTEIPTEFNEQFYSYNRYLNENGFDLGEYKGQTVTRYIYKITNAEDDETYAAVTVKDGTIICGEVFTSGEKTQMKPMIR